MKLKNFLSNKIKTHLELHETLNQKIWNIGEEPTLKDEVRTALMKVYSDFLSFLELNESDIVDVIFTGSNASFAYTDQSDLDLHLIADYDPTCKMCGNAELDDCLKAKKSLWNGSHNVEIHGYPVEVYIESSSENKHPVTSAGIYSLKNNAWIQKPERVEFNADDPLVIQKANSLMAEIDTLVDSNSNNETDYKELEEKIRAMRALGIAQGGEFSIENLAFKVIRNNGYVQKLYDAAKHVKDDSMSVKD
jgi:hypothetical protein